MFATGTGSVCSSEDSADPFERRQKSTTVILLEEIIERNIDKLFLNYDVVCAHPYRIMRNADLTIDEDEAEDLLEEIQKQLKKRQWGEVIRLEVEDKMDKRLLKILKKEFDIKDAGYFCHQRPSGSDLADEDVRSWKVLISIKHPVYAPAGSCTLNQNDDDILPSDP